MPTSVVAEVGSTANNYAILAKLATGGMAEIFLARGASAAGVERYVVLKRIIREKAHDTHFVQMFLEEARLAAQLQHANVAQVYDIGKLGDSYFFTMEYVHGETVRGLLQRARSLRREIPLGLVLTVIAGTAAGLHHAHDRIGIDGRPLGIVHRDVSPSNLMISYDGGIKLVDFGVAKAENRAGAHETRSGAVKGKISYLSPEQCRGVAIDRKSDLFSLGIVLWEMLTTERLYRRASDFENMTAIVNEPAPSPAQKRHGLPWDIEQLSLRLLAKNPEERFGTAQELVETIEELAAKNGLVLSVTALGRFMKELFGQRPEPWVEIETRDSAEGVTVTSEPLPPELAAAVFDPVEGELQRVRDLSHQVGSCSESGPSAGAVPSGPIAVSPTANLRVPHIVQPIAPAHSHSAPALPAPPSHPDILATIPYYRQPQAPAEAPPIAPPAPVIAAPVVTPSPLPRERGPNVKLIAIVAGLTIIAGLSLVIALRGGDEQSAAVAHDAAAPGVPVDAPAVAGPPIDVAEPAAVPVDAPEASVSKPPPPDPLAAVRAACTEKDLERAMVALRTLTLAHQRAAIAECRKLGVELARPRPKDPKSDPCKLDPMACQR